MNETPISMLAAVSVIGTSGTGATYWLTQINPWLAFFSGILTMAFMTFSLKKMWDNRKK